MDRGPGHPVHGGRVVSARKGRRNGVYAQVPLRLANDCPKCEAPRGRPCVKKVGDQFLPRKTTHAERREKRGGGTDD